MLVAFLITYLTTPILMKEMIARKVIGVDVHKLTKPVCAEMGGVAVFLGFAGAFCLITLLLHDLSFGLIGAFLTILLVGLVGVVDDLFTLRQRYKVILTALSGIPLILANTGRFQIWFPYTGWIYFGHFFWLLIPLGVAAASNLTNMLAGFNGLEAGIGAISCCALGILCAALGRWDAASLAFSLFAASVAFLKYNWYPAKIFPGDTGTLIFGGAIASISILGQVETAAIIILVPAAIDFILKMVSKSPFSHRRIYGDTVVMNDETLIPAPYPALCHAFMKVERLGERDLVLALLIMEALYCILGVVLILLVS